MSKDSLMSIKSSDNIFKKPIGILILVAFSILNLLPIFWGVVTSFKNVKEILAYPPKIFNFDISFEHYKMIINNGFFRAVLNSILYSAGSIVIGLFLALIAGYGIHRYQFKLKKVLFYIILAGIPLSIGSSALLIPNYIYLSKLGLTNHWYTLIILYAAYNLPMAIWIIIGGLESVPIEIDEAAYIDGCSKPYLIFGIIAKLIKPSIASAALFIFIGSWNEFIVAAVMIDSPGLRPVQMAIYNYLGFFGQEWGPLTAAASAAIVPTIIVFSFLGKMLISGLTQGSVKG